MARREYLSPDERARFDAPPTLTVHQRPILLDLPAWAEIYLQSVQVPTNKVGFTLQLGYFRVVTRFFMADRFESEIIAWVCLRLRVDPNSIRLADYARSRTAYRHREDILHHLGYTAFGAEHQRTLTDEAHRLAHLQTRPALMLDALAGYLREHRVEIPPYNALRTILTDALDDYQTGLEGLIDQYLGVADRALLDELLQKQPLVGPLPFGERPGAKSRYRLTGLKRISQSMQPKQIRGRIELFTELKAIFVQLAPLIERLSLSDDTIRYYAQYVLDTQSKQSSQRIHERYLRLIAFIVYQYLSVGDALILTFRQAVTTTLNDCEQTIKEQLYQSRQATAGLVGQVVRRSDTHIDALSRIETIVDNQTVSDNQKVAQIRQLLNHKRVNPEQLAADKQRLLSLKALNQPVADRDDFYNALEKESLRLQTRVSGIVQGLVFDDTAPDSDGRIADILAAIRYYQDHRGELNTNASLPLDFLDMDERQRVFTPTGKLRVSLYKVLLFRKLRDHLRDGSLNVLSSYEHRAFEEYMLPKAQWLAHRQTYLAKANLIPYAQPARTLVALNERLNEQFQRTNTRLATNPQVFFDKTGDWHLHRYRADDKDTANTPILYPINRVISLRDLLSQINRSTHFLDAFTHQGFGIKPTRPPERLLLAAVIGYGENIGIRKMGLISKNISVNALETVATHYFSPEMVLRANDLIVTQSNQLPLTDQFRRQAGFIHTGSDGQKYDVSIPTLRASASFKYFGNGQGITIYSHLDEAGQLIYSTAFSAADRESPYMLDAITYNEVITPDAHSTDQHGSTEPVFGVTGLIGVEFRPRFATIHRQQLYSIDAVSTYKEQGYRISPNARIDYDNLINQWDEVLRFVATIKLGYAKASQLFKRLNSYDRQHPLYRALRDLGRLYKTEYILRYIDDPLLRETVEGILTRVEHANRFAKAVVLGNNGQFGWATYHEQLIAEGCKRLIMNAINYWNLLYLSDKLNSCHKPSEREELLKAILHSNTHTWHHINLQGEYDFSEDSPAMVLFDLEQVVNGFKGLEKLGTPI